MKWMKIRTRWAWGYGLWDYIPLYTEKVNEDDKEDIVERYHDRYGFSDKFRGVEYDIIDTDKVPREVIKQKLKNLKTIIKTYTQFVKEIEQKVKSLDAQYIKK